MKVKDNTHSYWLRFMYVLVEEISWLSVSVCYIELQISATPKPRKVICMGMHEFHLTWPCAKVKMAWYMYVASYTHTYIESSVYNMVKYI